MKRILRQLDGIFNRAFTSKFNPLYSSGPIAVGLLLTALVTGLVLCFFYRLTDPYESVSAMQNDPWFKSWVRSTHRYASDGMVVAVMVHILRIFAQGKSWGPRTLAWISGVLLLFLMLVSGWTGFVLVWDTQAQAVAVGGAKIMDGLGIFSDSIIRSFDGSGGSPASFFFFNLFLHIVIPLAMVFGIWLHTAKMASATWLPPKNLMRGMTAAIVLSAVIWPAPLAGRADLLALSTTIPLDWFYNFWVPWTVNHPLGTFLVFACLFITLSLIPWCTRPRIQHLPLKSFNDQKRCQGCTQCVQDCPYEAISMMPRTEGAGSLLVANVNPDLCVSCGLCAASCAPFTMGPPSRKGTHQFSAARSFVSSLRERAIDPGQQILVVGCSMQNDVIEKLRGLGRSCSGFQIYTAECVGTVHATVVEHFARNFLGVVIVACPERNCINKDGYRLLRERLSGVREPTFESDSNRRKVRLLTAGSGEERALFRQLYALQGGAEPAVTGTFRTSVIAGISAVALMLGIAFVTRLPFTSASDSALLRLSLRLSGQLQKDCRARTEEELRSLPQHMRTAEICDSKALAYRLAVTVDGKELAGEQIHAGGLHSDRPIYVNRDLAVTPGTHDLNLDFTPIGDESGKAVSLSLRKAIRFGRGRIVLIYLSPDQRSFIIKGDEE